MLKKFIERSIFKIVKMSFMKVAVVTGSNKGIGFSIVEGLAKQFNGIVYLTGKKSLLLKPIWHIIMNNDNKIASSR